MPSIATLARREAEAACSGLIVGFANHIDRAEYPQVVALFASDATLERPGAALRGSREIEAFLHQRPRHVMTRHLCTNVSIDVVSEGRAEGSAYVLFFSAEAGADTHLPLPCAPSAVVEYHARFRQEDGQWRIDGLKIAPVFRA